MDRPRFNSLKNVPLGYSPEEWEFVISIVDALPRETLAKVCLEHGIDFGDRNSDVDEEDMVWSLMNHLTPQEAVAVAKLYSR